MVWPGVLVSWSGLVLVSWCPGQLHIHCSGHPGVSGLVFLVSWCPLVCPNSWCPGVPIARQLALVSWCPLGWSGHETNVQVKAVLAKNESCCLPTHFDIDAGQRVFAGQSLFDPLMKTIAVVVTVGLSIGSIGVSPKNLFRRVALRTCWSEHVFIAMKIVFNKIGG